MNMKYKIIVDSCCDLTEELNTVIANLHGNG